MAGIWSYCENVFTYVIVSDNISEVAVGERQVKEVIDIKALGDGGYHLNWQSADIPYPHEYGQSSSHIATSRASARTGEDVVEGMEGCKLGVK